MKTIGTSITVFGGLAFATGVALAPILDFLTIDPIALILMLMGFSLRSGKRKSIMWPAILCGWYCVISIAMIIVIIVAPDTVSFGKYHLSYRTGDILAPKIDAGEPLAVELAEFVRGVRTGDPLRYESTLARSVVRLVEAADQSLANGSEPVCLEPAKAPPVVQHGAVELSASS